VSRYRERLEPPEDADHTVALIYGVGGVQRGKSRVDPLSGDASMGSESVTQAFRTAVDDEKVVAIVFRVDSPGGSAVASDAIWRETRRAREAGKPVIVSMGNVAGSGGYYVAAGATRIVAQPATVTGSIGVFALKPAAREVWQKVGVTWDGVRTAENADMYSLLDPYDAAGWERLQTWLDWVYADFKSRVEQGRGLTAEQVEAVAKGRIWSGERALGLGLVDALGGVHEAIELAKQEAELAEDAEVDVAVYPRPKKWYEQLFEQGPSSSEDYEQRLQTEVAALEELRPVVRQLRKLGIVGGDSGVLIMPPVEISE
jgi:protease-4